MILPATDPSFAWISTEFGLALICRPLEPFATHFFTTRQWQLGRQSAKTVEDGWTEVATRIAVDERHLVRVVQVHGAEVIVAQPGGALPCQADVILSDALELAPAIRVADCVPLLLADRRTGAVAAVHAGWRGLAAGVPAVAVRAMQARFGSEPSDIIAAAGPSIGACCYEVGTDVRAAFATAAFDVADVDRWFREGPLRSTVNPSMSRVPQNRPGQHWFFDGWAATRDQLKGAGVPALQIFVAETCTASHAETFCSYRRDGAGAGRLAAAIRRSMQ